MKPAIALGLAMMIVAAGCGDASEPKSTAPQDPASAVGLWIEAVVSGDSAAVAAVVPDYQIALLVAIENPLSVAETRRALSDGLSAATQAAYWTSFVQAFGDSAGVDLASLEAAGSEKFAVDGRDFAEVTMEGEGRAAVVATRGEEGWLVDLMATLGPTLVRPLRDLVDALSRDANDEDLARLFGELATSLRAGQQSRSEELPPEFRSDLEALLQVLER